MKAYRLPPGVTVPYDVWVRRSPTEKWVVKARSQIDAKRKILALGLSLTVYELDAFRKEPE